MNTAVATHNAPNGAVGSPEPPLHEQIRQMGDKFKEALPAHIPVARFSRFSLLAISKPEIQKVARTPAGRRSIYDSLLRCAADGLLPDGREAVLVVYRSKIKGTNDYQDLVQYQSMVAGIMKKARNSGQIASIVCQIRYKKDPFVLRFVTDGPPVTHELPDDEDRGEMVGVYAVCRFKDGTWSQPEYLTKGQVDKIRARTKSRKADGTITGPWVTDYEEMARKTAIRRASKSWPSSTDMESLLETIRAGDDLTDMDTIDHAPIPDDRKKTQAASLLGHASEDDDDDRGPDEEEDEDEREDAESV